ncbi:MAG TPA: CpaD family pilus assembly protein [Pseudorhodoplanes sp.]|jgi:pilus assembly protein CpaD|nr:CpaD family pilus assembly protein [Pseudorhodoplanes sp.]
MSSKFAIARRAALVGVIAVTLAGCMAAGGKPQLQADAYPTDYRKRHPISIRENEQTMELFIGNNRGALTASQRAEVMAFAQRWKREGTGGIAIDLPTGTPNAVAANDALREVNAILAAAGAPPRSIIVRPYQPVDPAKLATLKLNFGRFVAEAGPCGLWPKDIGASMDRAYAENSQYWNLGCASQRNLAAMVDNPADLVQPRGETQAYTQRRTYALEQYRKGVESSTNYRNPNNGKISDVGQ